MYITLIIHYTWYIHVCYNKSHVMLTGQVLFSYISCNTYRPGVNFVNNLKSSSDIIKRGKKDNWLSR